MATTLPAKKTKHKRGKPSADPKKVVKRGYYLPVDIADAVKEFSHNNVSEAACGAFLVWMAMEKYPGLRETAIKSTNMPVKDAIERLAQMIVRAVQDRVVQEYIQGLSREQRQELLREKEVGAK